MKKQIGTVLFSNIVTQPVYDGKPTGKFEITLTLDEAQFTDAESNGLGATSGEYNGQAQYKAKFKSKFKLGKKEVVDRYKQPYVDEEGNLKEIPRGSKVVVFTTPKPYSMMGKDGITNYLNAIQIIDEATAIDFEDFSEELEEQDVEF